MSVCTFAGARRWRTSRGTENSRIRAQLTELETAHAASVQLQARTDQLASDKAQLQRNNTTLQVRLTEARADSDKLVDSLTQLQAMVQNLTSAKSKNEELLAQRAHADVLKEAEKVTQLRAHVLKIGGERDQALIELQKALDSQKDRLGLEKDNNRLKLELSNANFKSLKLSEEIDVLHRTIKTIELDAGASKRDVNETSRTLAARTENLKLTREVADLKRQLAAKDSDTARMQRDADALRNVVNELQGKVAASSQALNTSKESSGLQQELSKENAFLRDALKRALRELRDAKDERNNMERIASEPAGSLQDPVSIYQPVPHRTPEPINIRASEPPAGKDDEIEILPPFKSNGNKENGGGLFGNLFNTPKKPEGTVVPPQENDPLSQPVNWGSPNSLFAAPSTPGQNDPDLYKPVPIGQVTPPPATATDDISKTIADAIMHGEKLEQTGRYDDALTLYEAALARDARNAKLLLGKGRGLLHLGRLPEAVATLNTGLEVEPSNLTAGRFHAWASRA
ncbi:MAG: tetratricopeptide repeat protein, partial [Verrucomicrobiota bacterium]